MKRLMYLIIPLIMAVSIYAEPTRTDSSQDSTGTSTGDSGGLVVGTEVDQGTFTVTGGQLWVTNPTFDPPVVYVAPATASATAYKVLNISSATIMAAATTWTLANANYTDMITPRNLVFVSSAATTNTAQVMSLSALVTGKNQRGEATTETIAFSTTTGTGSVAWSTVTSVKITATTVGTGADTNITIDMGSGVKIGLPADLNTSGEVLKVIENAALSTTYTLNVIYDTITFAAAPDSTKHYQVWLRPRMR